MNKLALIFAFSFITAYGIKLSREDERDRRLMSLAKNICAEDFAGCRRDLLFLTKYFSDEKPIQGCIYDAMSDVVNIFDEGRAYKLLDEIADQARSSKFAADIRAIMEKYQSVHEEWVKAREMAVECISKLTLQKNSLPLIFKPQAGVKYLNHDIDADCMTPSEFFDRRPPVVKRMASAMPQPPV